MPSPRRLLPDVEPWDLPPWYRRLKAAVLELEDAREAGTLAIRLDDPELRGIVGARVADAYRLSAAVPPPERSAFRRAGIHAILEPVKEILENPRVLFPARGVEDAPPDGVPRLPDTGPPPWSLPARLLVEGPDGALDLPLHRAVSGRFWRIGFAFADERHERGFARLLVRRALDRLAGDLRGLRSVERRLAAKDRIAGEVRVVPDLEGRRIEQLMLDLLNETAEIAVRAPLEEDFLEKTDLRVRLPGLERRRGARVQVTITAHPARLERKLARIRRVEEFVILSPRSLAESLAAPTGVELLHRGELAALWECLPRRPAGVDELAALLRRSFEDALSGPLDDPRGPAARVPPPVARLVRAFVDHEARRATRRLRARQREGGDRGGGD